jgi:hypothetical protein
MAREKMGKRVSAISIEEVAVVFDGRCLQALAHMGRLPPDADLQVFAKVLHQGLRAYAQAAGIPSGNDVHREISLLKKRRLAAKAKTSRVCLRASRRRHAIGLEALEHAGLVQARRSPS